MIAMTEDFDATPVHFAFPTADWLDPFDAAEPAVQWFFVNQDWISRAWIAPAAGDKGWGFSEDEPLRETFNNPRSCLYCLEKAAVVADGQVLREWEPTVLVQAPSPRSCAQHNGLYFVYSQAQADYPVHEAQKYATYDEALAEALANRQVEGRVMVARMVYAESLW